MEKLKLWFLRKFRGIDTSPREFEIWMHHQIGKQLQGGQVFYAIAVRGRPGIPTIGEDWKLYAEFDDAESKRKRLQSGNPNITLELRIVRNFYSEVK
jgi:hypothetical protein